MSDIFIAIRNQNGNAMTSIEGVAFVAILKQSDRILSEQTVDLFHADVQFADLSLGEYIAVARHELVSPQEASRDMLLKADEIIRVIFIYDEPVRQLLRSYIETIPYNWNSY